jgi:type I restriction enzyme S subunit
MKALPSDWTSDRLKDVAVINASSLSADSDPDYEFDYLEISNVDYHGIVDPNAIERVRFEDAPSRARRRVTRNSTVISSVRPNLQAVAFLPDGRKDLVCSTGFNVVQPNEAKLCPRFAYFTLISEGGRQYFEATAKGVGYPAVDDKDFTTFAVPLPPLPEQVRIAAYLNASCAAIDAAVAAKRRQLETLDALRRSIIQRAVTEGIEGSVELRDSGVDVIAKLPIGWNLVRLKSIADIRYGLGQPPPERDGGVTMIRATDIDAGRIIEGNLLCIDPDSLPLGRDPYLKEGEIIVVRSGAYTGDSAIVPAKYVGAVAGYDMVVTVKRAVPEFVGYCLLSGYILEGQLLLLTLRAAQPHLNARELAGILLALPESRREQEAICAHLDAKLGEVKRIVAGIEAQITTLTAYRKSLIHECVTGQRRVTEADVARLRRGESESMR